jgi:hypothetical protein
LHLKSFCPRTCSSSSSSSRFFFRAMA